MKVIFPLCIEAKSYGFCGVINMGAFIFAEDSSKRFKMNARLSHLVIGKESKHMEDSSCTDSR